MSHRIDSKGVPEPLEPEAIKNFLSIGIPYRLAMLDLAEDVSPAQTTRDSAVIEAGMGLGIERRGGLRIVPRRSYYVTDGYTDE